MNPASKADQDVHRVDATPVGLIADAANAAVIFWVLASFVAWGVIVWAVMEYVPR